MGIGRRALITVFVMTGVSFGPASMFAVDFASPVSHPVGTGPAGVVVADFNGDGKPDIAVANSGSGNVSILLGNGDGTFQPAVNFDAGLSPNSIAVGYFDADSKLDLAVFHSGDSGNNASGVVSILLGNGNGTFQAPRLATLTIAVARMAAGDFNGDKKADLIVSNSAAATGGVSLEILMGNGDGTFQPAKAVPSTAQNVDFVVADFNRDGQLDLAIAVSGGVQTLLGQGNGTFQRGATAAVASGFTLISFLSADFNQDGSSDLIVSSTHRTCSGGFLCSTTEHYSVFLGNGNGSFGSEQIFATGGSAFFGFSDRAGDIVTGDFNGDGKVDMADRRTSSGIGRPRTTILEVRLGKGDGNFAPAIVLPDPGPLRTAQDLSGDKLPDLVALNSQNNVVAVLLNTSPTSGADLGIIASSGSPEPVGVGNNLTYTADVLNEGPKDATGVTFTDTLPNGVSFVSATAMKGSCIQSNGIVSCTIGSLPDTANAQITIVVTATATGTVTNRMSVTATETDLALANNSATQTGTVLPTYTLTVTKSGNGSGTVSSSVSGAQNPDNGRIDCGSACSAKFLSGAQVNLSATGDAGSFFQSWSGACSGNVGQCSLTMDGDKNVGASFVAGVTLSVTIAGGGSGSVTDPGGNTINCTNTGGLCSDLYFPGTSVSLTAVASGGSKFGGWSGACSGSDPNSCNVALNTNQTVTATFTPPPDFSLSPAAASLTVNRGGQVSDVLTFPTQGGFSGTIALACSVSGPSPMPTCGISSASVKPGESATLTVNAAALAAALTPPPFERAGVLYAAWLPLGMMGLALASGLDKKRRRMWLLCLLMMLATILPAACGGGSSGPPHPATQTFTVTVTGTSGAIQHSTNVTVTVR